MSTVHVSNISAATSDAEVRDFFSFCGKITSLNVAPGSNEGGATKSATVTFEKENAAKTALLLDHTQLGASQVHVEAAVGGGAAAAAAGVTSAEEEEELAQEDKPRTRVLAEYLAHGYVVSDQAIQSAIALDNKHGFSAKFTSSLQNFDQKFKASERAREMDKSYGLSERAGTSWRGLHSYFQKAIDTPTGQKVMDFYTQTEKQVLDVHTEARRLADIKAGRPAQQGQQPGAGFTTAQPGNAPREGVTAYQPVAVAGAPGRTTCQCAGNDGVCGCAPGECNCAGCNKASAAPAPGGPTALAAAAPQDPASAAADGLAQAAGGPAAIHPSS